MPLNISDKCCEPEGVIETVQCSDYRFVGTYVHRAIDSGSMSCAYSPFKCSGCSGNLRWACDAVVMSEPTLMTCSVACTLELARGLTNVRRM